MRSSTVSRLLSIAVAGSIAVGLTSLAGANHDDSTLRGLRVTVTDVSNFDVTVDILGRGSDSESLLSGQLGTQFYYDSAVGRWLNAVPPALDWGDGSTIGATGIPFDSPSTTGGGARTFTGQFMHTYAAPGNYTIRSFGTHVYLPYYAYYGYYPPSSIVTEGNIVSVASPAATFNSGSYTSTFYTGTYPIGVSATATVSVPNGSGSGGPGSPPPAGPAVRDGNCGLIGIELLAVYPVWALARRRRESAIA